MNIYSLPHPWASTSTASSPNMKRYFTVRSLLHLLFRTRRRWQMLTPKLQLFWTNTSKTSKTSPCLWQRCVLLSMSLAQVSRTVWSLLRSRCRLAGIITNKSKCLDLAKNTRWEHLMIWLFGNFYRAKKNRSPKPTRNQCWTSWASKIMREFVPLPFLANQNQ